MPSDVWKETPHALLSIMFMRMPSQPVAVPLDSVTGLTRTNKAREKSGLPPIAGRGFKSVLQSVPDAKSGVTGAMP